MLVMIAKMAYIYGTDYYAYKGPDGENLRFPAAFCHFRANAVESEEK
jgi:hypothetical protein